METIAINSRVKIPLSEIEFSFARSGGPGGQNVNKVETKVVLRFDLLGSEALSSADRDQAARKLEGRLTKSGELIVQSERFRDRERNRADAIERFQELLRSALVRPRRRVATKPSRGAKERRLSEKKQRGERKRQRSRPGED